MRTYYEMLRDRNEADTVGKMKQFATYFTHGVRNGSKLRVEIYRTMEAGQILDCVNAFFEAELEAVPAVSGPPEEGPADHRRGLHRQSRARRVGLRASLRRAQEGDVRVGEADHQ